MNGDEGTYAAIGDLVCGDNLAHLRDEGEPPGLVPLVRGSDLAEAPVGAPESEAAAIGFGLDVLAS